MKRSTSSIWTGILLLFCAYCCSAMAVVSGPAGWWVAALPFGLVGGGMVLAGIVSIGVRWALEDVHEQRAIERLDDLEDEAYGGEQAD